MNFKNWKTKISKQSCVIGKTVQNELGELIIQIENAEKEKFEIKVLPEIYEIGSEEHYFDLWKILNKNELNTYGTTLIIENSEWLNRFSTVRENKTEFEHFMIIGIDKVINLISEKEPIIKKLK